MAMVLAYYFPKLRVLWFGLACFNAMCRVIKGSHFPTDVLGGLLVGIGSGLVLVYAREKMARSNHTCFCSWTPVAHHSLRAALDSGSAPRH